MRLLDTANKFNATVDHVVVQLSPLSTHCQELADKTNLITLLSRKDAPRKDVTNDCQLFPVTSAPDCELDAIAFAHVVVQHATKLSLDVDEHLSIISPQRYLSDSNMVGTSTSSPITHYAEVTIGVEEAPKLCAPQTVHVGIIMPTNAHKEATRR